MGETRVDLYHLLEDLRDAYPGALEETILTEIVANSLDSGARLIALACDPASATLTVTDDGSGMQRRELARFHDVAASTKKRGQGIGFAGVGIKLALLLCEEVVTETRRGKSHVATRWRLASRHKAPWKWEPPAGRVAAGGTAVRMKLTNPLSPLLDAGYMEDVLARHYRPLLEESFRPLLASHYPRPIRLEVNGRPIVIEARTGGEVARIEVKLPRRRRPSAVGYLVREAAPLSENQRGLAVSTLGKVIKRGWDWLALSPAMSDRIGGVIEVPALAECLTLNKADFIRTGTRGATFLAYRKAIQEAVARQLAAWGDVRDGAEEARRRAARPVERDLERVLIDLADEFPLIATLVERREGGQRRLPIGSGPLIRGTVAGVAQAREAREVPPPGGAQLAAAGEADTANAVEGPRPEAATPGSSALLPPPAGRVPRRPARYGLEIKFERREGEADLGRLIESTVWINEVHPAYQRAAASRSEGYHLALSVAMVLAPLAVEPAREREFVAAFLERWGRALRKDGRVPRRRGRQSEPGTPAAGPAGQVRGPATGP